MFLNGDSQWFWLAIGHSSARHPDVRYSLIGTREPHAIKAQFALRVVGIL